MATASVLAWEVETKAGAGRLGLRNGKYSMRYLVPLLRLGPVGPERASGVCVVCGVALSLPTCLD